MAETQKRPPPEPEVPGDGDEVTRFVRDLATASPPKSVETMKAATDAVEKAAASREKERRDGRIRDRAYFLWMQSGRPPGKHEDFWLKAEAEHEDHHKH